MLDVKICVSSSGKILGFQISGHCGYAENGKDVVCAAVSSAAYMVVNTIADVLNIDAEIDINQEGEMNVMISEKDERYCRVVFEGFKLHLTELENLYPRNIKINYLEVNHV